MAITEKIILEALGKVEDPDLKKDLVTLNMVRDLAIVEKRVAFTLVLTTPACPLKEFLRSSCVKAIEEAVGSDVEIDINITSEVTTPSNTGKSGIPGIKNIVAISSGKGGVGKSTVSTNLAVALANSGAKVGLIDADIFGPSIPVMFGIQGIKPGIVQEDGKNWLIPVSKYGVKLMSIGFLTPEDSAVIWRGPMASSALRQFFNDTKWGELDYLLIDLPPGTSDIHLTMVQTVPVSGAVVVTTPQKVALADAKKALEMFKQPKINVPVLGLVENMAYFSPPELPENKYYIFGENGGKIFADNEGLELLGQIPIQEPIRALGDEGAPPSLDAESKIGIEFRNLAENLAQQVAKRNAIQEDTKVVEINPSI